MLPYLGPEMIELLLQLCRPKTKEPQSSSKPCSVYPNSPQLLVLDVRVDEEFPE
jgi:hypothetical protein